MGRVLSFTGKSRRTRSQPVAPRTNGTVEIWPSDAWGGCWAVFHRSRSGDSLGHVGDFFALDQAEAAAQVAAKQYGAVLGTGVSNG